MEIISERTCRLCLSQNGSLHLNIFSEMGLAMKMCDIIREHFKCEIDEMDCMPNFVCSTCWSLTQAFHELYKKSKIIQEKYMPQMIIPEPDAMFNDQWQQNNKEIYFIDESELDIGPAKLEESDDTRMDYDTLRFSDTDESESEIEYKIHENEENCRNVSEIKKCDCVSTDKGVKKQRKPSARRAAQIKKRTDFEKFFAENKHFFDMTCDFCPTIFESFYEARSHYASEHNNPSGYVKCCGLKILHRCKVREHLIRHLDPDSLKCTECDKSFFTPYYLQIHIKEHTEKRVRKKEDNVICDICKKMFTRKNSLKSHLKRHLKWKDSPYDKFIKENFDLKCDHDLCSQTFTTLHDARRHYKEQHNENNGYIKCCNTKLRELSLIRDHIKSHLKPDSFKCDICSKTFTTRVRLYQHKRHHQKTMSKAFICDYCGKRFRDKEPITRHILNTHAGLEAKFECNVCQKMFKLESLLKHHYISHKEKKLDKICTECGKGFHGLVHLKNHMLTHMSKEERTAKLNKYKCKYCPKSFNVEGTLRQHITKTHKGKKKKK